MVKAFGRQVAILDECHLSMCLWQCWEWLYEGSAAAKSACKWQFSGYTDCMTWALHGTSLNETAGSSFLHHLLWAGVLCWPTRTSSSWDPAEDCKLWTCSLVRESIRHCLDASWVFLCSRLMPFFQSLGSAYLKVRGPNVRTRRFVAKEANL